MKKLTIAMAILVSLGVTSCANTDIFGGDVYTAEQSKEARSVSYGTIVGSRAVKIQAESQGVIGTVGGGALGGVAGSAIGGGSGRAIATAVGAVAGAVIGNKVEQKASQVDALELTIKKDNGEEIVVVQKADSTLKVGTRVRIVGGSTLNVSAL